MNTIKETILNELNDYFNENEKVAIIKNLADFNEDIDLKSIIDKVTPSSFYKLYQKLLKKERFINDKFDIYHFLKTINYFDKNKKILNDIDKIKDNDLDNLILAINYNIDLDYNELLNIKEDIIKNNDPYVSLIGLDKEECAKFIETIMNPSQIAYLLLEFKGMEEETYLKALYNYSRKIESFLELDDDRIMDYVNSHSNIPNYMFQYDSIKKNLRDIYTKLYVKNQLDLDKLKELGKAKLVEAEYNDGRKYQYYSIEIDGTYDFQVYVHNSSFRDYNKMDFTESYDDQEYLKNNYFCTSYLGKYNIVPYENYYKTSSWDSFEYYKMDENALMSFGNRDLYIKNIEVPAYKDENGNTIKKHNSIRYTAKENFVNPLDMQFNSLTNYLSYAVPTEFDFQAVTNEGKNFEKENRILYVNVNKEKITENIDKEYAYYLENINTLKWKELYTLLGIAKNKYQLNENLISEVQNRIIELPELEQVVLNNAIKDYTKVHGRRR